MGMGGDRGFGARRVGVGRGGELVVVVFGGDGVGSGEEMLGI